MSDAASGRWVFVVAGAALVLGGIASFARQRLRFARWTATRGTIVGHRVRRTVRKGRSRTFYHPVVRFEAGGREWTHESSLSTSERRREEGSSVMMLYDPSDPGSACIDDVREKYFIAMFLGAIGAVFTAVGGWLGR